jgi:hypothetical protein
MLFPVLPWSRAAAAPLAPPLAPPPPPPLPAEDSTAAATLVVSPPPPPVQAHPGVTYAVPDAALVMWDLIDFACAYYSPALNDDRCPNGAVCVCVCGLARALLA